MLVIRGSYESLAQLTINNFMKMSRIDNMKADVAARRSA